jgi:hypothetical protein
MERVQAYSTDLQTSSTESDETLLRVSLFVLGDLFTALIRTGKTVALAVFQATGITHKSRKVGSVSVTELALEGADITISGQVLHEGALSSTTLSFPKSALTS